MSTTSEHSSLPTNWTLTRRLVTAIVALPLSMVWTHGLAALLRPLGPADAPLVAVGLTLAALATTTLGCLLLPRFGMLAAVASAVWATGVIAAAAPGAWAGALALPLGAGAALAIARRIGERVPADLGIAKRPLLALSWTLLALLGVGQTARLATNTTDPSIPFILTTTNPFWAGHLCLPAYLHGAELATRGEENVYASHHYPALDATAEPKTELGMTVEDPFQYPPQFLVLPALALAITTDFSTLRITWFALQMTLYFWAFAALALWIGGRAGRAALWALPTTLGAFPLLHNFQFGQFHLPAVALAVLAMLAFARNRASIGGLMLAGAILSKVFPVVLIPLLIGGRRWRALGWTFAWGALLTLIGFAVLGPAPFVAFFDHHLPRLSSGAAFAFDEAWPELAELVVVDNQGVYGLTRKLGGSKELAAGAGRIYFLAVLAGALWLGRRAPNASRWARAVLWLGLIGLGSLASAGAWGDYVPSTAVWLLAVLALVPLEHRRWIPAFVVLAALEGLLLGTMPIGEWADPRVMLPLATLGNLGLLLLFGLAAARSPETLLLERDTAAGASDPTGTWRTQGSTG